jgi:hypothetical protein
LLPQCDIPLESFSKSLNPETDDFRKHISTGEEAILVAVDDQLARIPPDRSGDGMRLHQACGLCWD